MKMKKTMIFALLVSVIASVSAANKLATDYYQAGEYQTAKAHFLAGNVDAMDSYYLGQIYFIQNKKDSAQYYFNKGLQLDPTNAYNSIGLAALKISTDPKTADNDLKVISKLKTYKKDAVLLTAIAEAYQLNGNDAQANTYLTKAKSANKKCALPYILEGDKFAAQKNNGEAAVRYENAIYFDPNSKAALLKLANLYESTRTQMAFDYLRKAIEVDPQYAIGYATLGEMSYRKGFYPQAMESYEKYLSLVKPTTNDYAQYATILYFNKQYAKALEAINKAPKGYVMDRLKMYSLYELGNLSDASAVGSEFMKSTNVKDVISKDYSTYAKILSKEKKYEESASNYELAYNSDTTTISYISDAAKAFEKAKNYTKAIQNYEKAISKNPTHSMADIYTLGGAYYNAGLDSVTTKDKAQRKAFLQKADSTFNSMSTLFPDHYLGALSAARTNSALDPETTQGLAKPYYEKALAIMLPSLAERKNEILECYRYLGYYYYVKNQLAQSKTYWNKVLEIDPTDNVSLQVIKNIDIQTKKGK